MDWKDINSLFPFLGSNVSSSRVSFSHLLSPASVLYVHVDFSFAEMQEIYIPEIYLLKWFFV